MIIIRIIIVLALFWITLMVLGWLAKWWLLRKFRKASQQQQSRQQGEPGQIEEQSLIKCKQCGTYIVKENAIVKNNESYCSEAHAKENR